MTHLDWVVQYRFYINQFSIPFRKDTILSLTWRQIDRSLVCANFFDIYLIKKNDLKSEHYLYMFLNISEEKKRELLSCELISKYSMKYEL